MAFDQGRLLDRLEKALTERALNAQMDHHLAGKGGARNSGNGYGRKSVHRVIQWPAARRVPEHALVLEPGRRPGQDRGVATGLQ